MKIKTWMTALFAAVSTVEASAASPLDIPYQEMPLVKVNQADTMILSDCPEYAAVYGILAEGTIPKGKGRLYYYHVNQTGRPARLVVYGTSDRKQQVKVTRTLRGEPSQSYIPTGKTLSFREVTSVRQEVKEVTVEKGKRTILYEENPKGIDREDLVSGMVEIETRAPVRLGTAMLPDKDDVEKNLGKASPLPPDTHEMRGTFPMHLYFENESWDISEGAREVDLGSAESHTPFFVSGTDELNLLHRENTGNYGITCHFTIHSRGEGAYDVYLNPNGGSFEGTIEIGQNKKALRIYETKRPGRRWFGQDTIYDYMKLGTWEAGKDLFIKFIPPGACYFPIRFLFVPHGK